MRPIRKGDRGAAVEDVQRRLLTTGVDLGSTGVDGVFLGATYAAVVAFQRERGLAEDGVVGPETWSALVDATFSLGDRLLYLRLPYLHGADVASLQHALNALGFSCGAADAIFGAFTERALRDFQTNAGLDADGIVGPSTVRAIENLRHVWADKPSVPPAELRTAPARSASILARSAVRIVADSRTEELAARLINLALASEECARLSLSSPASGPSVLTLTLESAVSADTENVVAAGTGGVELSGRIAAAITAAADPERHVRVVFDDPCDDEHALQAMAVAVLDGVCLGLAGAEQPVVP